MIHIAPTTTAQRETTPADRATTEVMGPAQILPQALASSQ
jgi:hypothetical protein